MSKWKIKIKKLLRFVQNVNKKNILLIFVKIEPKAMDIIYIVIVVRKLQINYIKNLHTHEYICCNTEELWNHLEKQYKEGMTRQNYGSVWHVDHIIPLQFFIDNDLMDDTNKKIACHYGNLQPLFKEENLQKSDKLPENTNFKYFNT